MARGAVALTLWGIGAVTGCAPATDTTTDRTSTRAGEETSEPGLDRVSDACEAVCASFETCCEGDGCDEADCAAAGDVESEDVPSVLPPSDDGADDDSVDAPPDPPGSSSGGSGSSNVPNPDEPIEPGDANSAGTPIPGVALLDDAEDGDFATLTGEGFLGYWYTFDDRQDCTHPDLAAGNVTSCDLGVCAASGWVTPEPYQQSFGRYVPASYEEAGIAPPPLEGSQRSNSYGVRVTGAGHTHLGAGIGVGLYNPGTLSAFDLAEPGYERLRFLARSGAPGRQFRLAVRVTDVYSEPSAGLCVHAVLECGASTCSCEGPQGCFDHPTVEVVVTDDWLLYELPLSSFRRGGWGTFFDEAGVPPAELDVSRAHQVQFFVPTDGDPLPEFDLWLDDIGFTLASAEPGDPSTVPRYDPDAPPQPMAPPVPEPEPMPVGDAPVRSATGPSFAETVGPIFAVKCTPSCHEPGGLLGGPGGLGTEGVEQDLTLNAAYQTLTTQRSKEVPTLWLVGTGLDDSYLWHKLNGTFEAIGGRGSKMPVTGEFTASDMEAVKAWIEGGASP